MIKYVIRAKKLPGTDIVRYYAQIAPMTPITLSQIIKRIETRCTVSSSDVKAVIDALQYEVIDALQSGNSIRLSDLGSFRLTIKAIGYETSSEAKKAGANGIRTARVHFTKSVAMKEALSLKNLEFSLQSDISND